MQRMLSRGGVAACLAAVRSAGSAGCADWLPIARCTALQAATWGCREGLQLPRSWPVLRCVTWVWESPRSSRQGPEGRPHLSLLRHGTHGHNSASAGASAQLRAAEAHAGLGAQSGGHGCWV